MMLSIWKWERILGFIMRLSNRMFCQIIYKEENEVNKEYDVSVIIPIYRYIIVRNTLSRGFKVF